uniref:Uncharacterized protein n=1 Tax=Pithovirus LCPAC403 TaxID=2506596 RepID=A0A481ZCB8_9VIRU|nr:MAG: hypothetical protein LCPAC403_02590 [Pithovirus LCPAC403]
MNLIVSEYFNSISDDDKLKNTAILFNLSSHRYYSVFRWYKSAINNFLVSDEVNYTSGFCCFIGSICFALSHDGIRDFIDELFRYSTLYILLDHYIDDPVVQESGKRKLIKTLTKVLLGLPDTDVEIQREKDIVCGFNLILSKIPGARMSLEKIYHEEINTYRLQSFHDLTREEYLSLALNKGGYTLNAIESILKINPTKEAFDLGGCIQLDDDLRDVIIDMSSNINTIATHDFRVEGNLDRLALYTAKKIHELDDRFIVFKVALMGMLVHTVVVNTYFTSELRDSLEEYLLIDKRVTHEVIISLF